MIEVNRRIYMNEVTGERLISFESVKQAVGGESTMAPRPREGVNFA